MVQSIPHFPNLSTNSKPSTSRNATQNNVQLRSYQKRIVEQAINDNTLVVLPTGAGKTILAAQLILRVRPPAVFLVPTILLVEQQCAAIANWTKLNVCPFSGGLSLPSSFDILVTTPMAFKSAQSDPENVALQWSSLRCVVFDEVHHVLKDHPYRKLALSLHQSTARPRVLGLTASYTYAVGEAKVKAMLQNMCKELRITNLQTADEAELRQAGYHALTSKAEVLTCNDFSEIPEGVLPHSERRPHLMLKTFLIRVCEDTVTKLSGALAKTVLQMEMAIIAKDASFVCPVQKGYGVKEWGCYVSKRATHVPATHPCKLMYAQLEHWCEALRILVVSWEEDEYAAVLFLRMFQCDKAASHAIWPLQVRDFINQFWETAPTSFLRLDRLRNVLISKVRSAEQFRGLLFVQQRVTTHVLEYFVKCDEFLNKHLTPSVLYAASTPATPSLRVSKSKAAQNIKEFANGKVNLLIATVVAEEGMDVPAANCVIRFDVMQHAVSLVQGRGRARQENSSFVVLRERNDRPTSVLANVEKQQIELIQNFKLEDNKIAPKNKYKVQLGREANALNVLYGELNLETAISKLNIFCQKTRITLQVSHIFGKNKKYETLLKYKSSLREIVVREIGRDKKISKRKAAVKMVMTLRQHLEKN